MYDYQTLTLTNIDGSISPFPNGASGLILLGTGTSTPPVWTSLADAGIATKTYVDNTFLPFTGGALTGALTGTSASFSGGVTATGGFTGNLTGTASNAAKVANALSIQLGTGTAQSYDGSNPLSVSVTPAAIGAALASHEHALTDITSAWPTAGLMVSNGTTVQPTSIAWPSGTNSDGAYLLLHYKNGTFTDTWEKFAGISSGAGILHWTGTATGATLNLLQTEHEGYVLARTSSGYDFISLGSAIVPPITGLACDSQEPSSQTTNRNQMVLFRDTYYTGHPQWRLIYESDIYGAPLDDLSVLVNTKSDGVTVGNTVYSSSSWVGVTSSDISTAPKILAAKKVGNNDTLDFFSASDLGLVTSIPNIKGLEVGEASTASKVLLGNASETGHPSWADSAPKADILTTARTLTIGNTGKTFDGSVNVSWSQNEIGFASGQTASYTFTETGWYRIAVFPSSVRRSVANFKFFGNGNDSASGVFSTAIAGGKSPQINLISFSKSGSNSFLRKARIVYSDASGAASYLEINVVKNTINISINFEMFAYSNVELLSTATQGSDESASNYNVLEYEFSPNSFGNDGQFLKTNKSVSGSTTTVSHSWQTLTVPSAPSSLPLVDNETGALGTAGTYANADHQHPLPYAVQSAYKFFYPRKIGIGGAVTAEAQEYDGTSDLILQVTEIDPNAIINTVPIEKGGTGASTASAALTNLGAAASNHNHDSTYLKLSGGNMTGTINTPANITPLYWVGKSGVATFVSGDLTAQDNVNSYVTGRRQNINLYDSDVSSDSASPTTINHTAKNDTTVNIICGINEVRRYIRYINLPTPTADMLGDTITIYFTNQKPSVIAELFATCSTNYRIKSYDYSNFGNTAGVDANCKWSSGNVVQFTCINLENNGTTYYWRAVKLVEQSW